MKYQAIVFDLFGTLIDTGRTSVGAMEKILAKHDNSQFSPDLLYQEWRNQYREVLRSLDAFQPEVHIYSQALGRLYRKYGISGDPDSDIQILCKAMLERILYPDALPVLKQLRRRYSIIIGSNSDQKPFRINLQRHKIKVDYAICSEELRVYKPDLEFYKKVLSLAQLAPRATLWVGDTPAADVAGPMAAGIDAIWLNRCCAELPPGCKPVAVIESLSGLEALL